MKSITDHVRSLAVAVLVLAFVVACGGNDEVEVPTNAPTKAPTKAQSKAPSQASKKPDTAAAKPSAPGKKPSSERKAPPSASVGEQLQAEVEIPEYYPEDAPIYPGTKPAQAQIRNGRASLMFGTPDSPADVDRYMSDYLRDQGWNPQSQRQGDRTLMQGIKDGRTLTVLVSRADVGKETETTLIAVSVDAK